MTGGGEGDARRGAKTVPEQNTVRFPARCRGKEVVQSWERVATQLLRDHAIRAGSLTGQLGGNAKHTTRDIHTRDGERKPKQREEKDTEMERRGYLIENREGSRDEEYIVHRHKHIVDSILEFTTHLWTEVVAHSPHVCTEPIQAIIPHACAGRAPSMRLHHVAHQPCVHFVVVVFLFSIPQYFSRFLGIQFSCIYFRVVWSRMIRVGVVLFSFFQVPKKETYKTKWVTFSIFFWKISHFMMTTTHTKVKRI